MSFTTGGSKYYNVCYGLKRGKLFQLEKIINVYPHPKNTKLPGDAVGGSEGLNGKRLLKGPYWNTTATAGIPLQCFLLGHKLSRSASTSGVQTSLLELKEVAWSPAS